MSAERIEDVAKVEGPSSLSSERLTLDTVGGNSEVVSESKKTGVGDSEREGMRGESFLVIDTGVSSLRRRCFLRGGVNKSQ